ncbi:MAG: hypothetical protein LBQ40_05575, partial [Clostridiales bacterium]|nr:hypothetical protein [Clostridiales bacterium]
MQTKAKRSTPPPNITRLAPDKSFGLTAQQVAERQALGLKNQNTAVRSKSYSKIIFENVANFYSIVTLSLMALLTAIGAWDYALSSCILFISIAIGIYQEIKAKIIVEKLTLVASSFFDALRNGEYVSVAGAELLLDELFVLKSGGQVPVDGTIVEGRLELDESILTGESHSVKKDEGGEILAG